MMKNELHKSTVKKRLLFSLSINTQYAILAKAAQDFKYTNLNVASKIQYLLNTFRQTN